MSIKHYFANMGIAGNYALGKMFVLMSSLRISKKVTCDFYFLLEVLQAHCALGSNVLRLLMIFKALFLSLFFVLFDLLKVLLD